MGGLMVWVLGWGCRIAVRAVPIRVVIGVAVRVERWVRVRSALAINALHYHVSPAQLTLPTVAVGVLKPTLVSRAVVCLVWWPAVHQRPASVGCV